jgi:histidyl-tRNA synthetase
MVAEILTRAGLSGFRILLNSVGCPNCRPQFNALLRERLAGVKDRLCADCQRRAETNPLRVLDCKVPEDQPVIDELPSIIGHLCAECRDHFERVQILLGDRGIGYDIKPRMVRGLDYYMRTTFEVVHGSLGAQNSVLGGGRYDGLAQQLGAKQPAPGIGFSIGEDRLVMTVEEQNPGSLDALDLYIAPLGADALRHATGLAARLRRAGIRTELGPDAKLKRGMEIANKLEARHVLIVGDNEVAAASYALKNMASGEQANLAIDEVLSRLAPAG